MTMRETRIPDRTGPWGSEDGVEMTTQRPPSEGQRPEKTRAHERRYDNRTQTGVNDRSSEKNADQVR